MMTISKYAAAAIVAIALTTSAARAQEGRGRIIVKVHDSTGVIPGATVVATTTSAPGTTVPAPSASVTASTDGEGVAVLDGLAAGSYDVRVMFTGFADAS